MHAFAPSPNSHPEGEGNSCRPFGPQFVFVGDSVPRPDGRGYYMAALRASTRSIDTAIILELPNLFFPVLPSLSSPRATKVECYSNVHCDVIRSPALELK